MVNYLKALLDNLLPAYWLAAVPPSVSAMRRHERCRKCSEMKAPLHSDTPSTVHTFQLLYLDSLNIKRFTLFLHLACLCWFLEWIEWVCGCLWESNLKSGAMHFARWHDAIFSFLCNCTVFLSKDWRLERFNFWVFQHEPHILANV